MIFEQDITNRMKRFVEADKASRDYRDAAEILLRASGNVVQYNMVMRKGPDSFADYLDKRITELYEFRLSRITHEEVSVMKSQASAIAEAAPAVEKQVRAGKRPDHDSLPQEIQALYAETLDLLRKQRELHLQIRKLALSRSTCPDSDLYPFVKEMIALDNRRLSLWKKYDSFSIKEK